MADDVFLIEDDDDLAGPPIEADDSVDTQPTDVVVCEEPDGDGICGYSGTAQQVRMHKIAKHRKRDGDAPKKTSAKRTTRRKPAAKKATDTATGSTTSRSVQYTASIMFFATAAYVAVPPFDEYDLSVFNAGAPNLGSALDEVGEQNATVRQACDLILGGGAGGAWLKLIMALGSIAMPIAAHHGVVPGAAGARFSEMAGVPPEPPVSPESAQEETTRDEGGTPTVDDVLRFMSNVPETVMTDAAMRMMQGAGPTVVDVPSSVAATMRGAPDDGERGSEQPNPEAVAVS